MGEGEKLLTHLNSALKVLLGLDIFPRVPRKVNLCCPVKYVNTHIFSQLTWLSQTNCGWRRKTTYTFEFSVKSSIRIRYFSSCAKKKVKFCWPVLSITIYTALVIDSFVKQRTWIWQELAYIPCWFNRDKTYAKGHFVGSLGTVAPRWALVSSFTRFFLDHTQRHITVGRSPLDEWSVRRGDLYLATHNTHNRQTSMPLVGFEFTIAAGERP